MQRASASAPASSAAGASPGGGSSRHGTQQWQRGEEGHGVPGFIFKAVALIREDLIACEWYRWERIQESDISGNGYIGEGLEALVAVLSPRERLTSHILPAAAAAVDFEQWCLTCRLTCLPPAAARRPPGPPAGHNLVAGVIDPSQAEDGMLVAAGVSSELDALKATYLDLPEFLTSVVESELGRVPRALARAAESRLWSILYMPQVGEERGRERGGALPQAAFGGST